MMALVKSQTCN